MGSSAGRWVILSLLMGISSTVSAQQCILDLVYVVDSSGSINYKDPRNWDITLEFLVNVTRQFTIGPNDVQVAFVLFSADATVRWSLTRYQDQASLIRAIEAVPYIGDTTNLNDGLYLTRTRVFAPGQGTRAGALKAAIILTDGEDNVPVEGTPLTLQNATACKRDGIQLIGIGVSDQVDEQRLRQIVSPPSDTHYYPVDDFRALMNIVAQLTPLVCVTTTAAPTGTCSYCNIELAFLLDSSTKTDSSAWTQMLNYVSSVVQGYTISSTCVRVAVIRYSNNADASIQLTSYGDVNRLVQAIGQIQFLGGSSNLAAALDLLRTQVFASNAVRSNTVQIAVIVTDQLQSSSQITTAANSVKNQGITIVGVAITAPVRNVDLNFFNSTVSDRSCLIQVGDYSQLISGAREPVVTRCACIEYIPPIAPEPVKRDCLVDLAYVVDSSGSINDKNPINWNITLEFLVSLTRMFTIGRNSTQVAFVLFSEVATVEWNLTRYQDEASLIAAIWRVLYIGSYTNLNDALYLTRTQVFAAGQGRRQGARKAAIILTDGVDNVPTNGTELTVQNATLCKNQNIELFAVGVSDQVNEQRLKEDIISRPTDRYYHPVANFNALTSIVNELSRDVCGDDSSG